MLWCSVLVQCERELAACIPMHMALLTLSEIIVHPVASWHMLWVRVVIFGHFETVVLCYFPRETFAFYVISREKNDKSYFNKNDKLKF